MLSGIDGSLGAAMDLFRSRGFNEHKSSGDGQLMKCPRSDSILASSGERNVGICSVMRRIVWWSFSWAWEIRHQS